MKNINYIINGDGSVKCRMEIYVCDTNEVDPCREIKELGIVILGKDDFQIDFNIEHQDIDSLIYYLTNVKKYIDEFNSKSEPK